MNTPLAVAAMTAPLWGGALAIAWQVRKLTAAIRRYREDQPMAEPAASEAPAPGQPRPIGPPLDEHGHFPPGGDYDLWHMAAWIPIGGEAAVAELLAGQGVEVYRMWPAREDGRG